VTRGEAGYSYVVEPIPETAEAIEELESFGYLTDMRVDLDRKAKAVRALVPELVGLSLAALEDGITFTLVATDADIAMLDAVQYLTGGPCVDAVHAGEMIQYRSGRPDDERAWQTFAQATAAKAVAATLTLPVHHDGRVVGSVNLYAAATGAFRGLHNEIAKIFGAWAPGAITNADLSFRTRAAAAHAPETLHITMRVETAVGVLMEAESVNADTARGLLVEAAQRAGVTTEVLAEAVLELFG
jgi:GAF domain-containing protein